MDENQPSSSGQPPPPGPPAGHAEFLALVYEELRRRAADAMRGLPPGQTLQPTALVHEAYANLLSRGGGPWRDEQHFLAVATLAIRAAIVDRIRARKRLKRGGGQAPVPFNDEVAIAMPSAPDDVVLGVDRLIDELRARDARAADVVAYRFFMGMTEAQCAAVLGVTERTVRRDWTFARSWLMKRLAEEGSAWSPADGG